MAEKDLGALILRIQADVTQLKTAIDAVNKVGAETDKTATKVTGLKSSFKGLLNVLPGCISQFLTLRSVMKIDRKFTEQVKIQEEAIARLNSALISTKGIAGLTIKDFDKMADALQKTSTRTRAEIANTQSILAAFTNIRGEVFQQAAQASLNLADAFEMDLAQVTRSIGKALQDPVKGMLALQRIGLGLTPVIQNQVKNMMAMNDVLGAQKALLEFLGTRLNYTSELLAKTLPGAIQQTKNAWDNLFRVGQTKGVEKYRQSLLKLKDALESVPIKEFFADVGSGWYTIKAMGANMVKAALDVKELLVIVSVTAAVLSFIAALKLLTPILTVVATAVGVPIAAVGTFITTLGLVVVTVRRVIGSLAELKEFMKSFDLSKFSKDLFKKTEEPFTFDEMKKTLFKWADKSFFSKEETEAAKEAEDQVRKNIAAIEEMRIEAEEAEYQMKILFDHVKYNGKSVESAITEINEKLKKTAKYDLVNPTKLNDSWVILKQYKEMLETMSNKTFKNFAKASKEAFTGMVESINNQMEFLGTPGESFLPGLNTMLKQFPVLSEQWVTIKKLVLSIENEIVEKQIANAKIVREFKEKQEEELSEKIQKEMKKREQQWENMFALNKLGFMPSSDLLAKATEEYKRLLDLYKTNPTDYLNWPKELIKSYEQVHNLLVEKVQPVMDTLNAQFENGTITNAQYVSALEKIKVQFEAYPSIVKLAEDAIVAFNLSAQASLPTVAGQVQSAWNDMNMAIAQAPSSIGDAFVSAIRGAENLGDAMRNLLQDIGAVIAKALIMKYIVGPIMGFADGGLVGSVGTPASAVGLDNWVGAKSIFGRGGVFDSGQLTAFASGGIVNKPTLFPFASGVGLMGEAGPEAIMPLKRTPSGDLGVQAEGGAGMTNITMNINAVDSKSFVEMVRTNRASVESIVVENIMRNGAVRGAIRGMA